MQRHALRRGTELKRRSLIVRMMLMAHLITAMTMRLNFCHSNSSTITQVLFVMMLMKQWNTQHKKHRQAKNDRRAFF